MKRVFVVSCVLVACTGASEGPSRGDYTVDFPSTAAAVATDFVQVLVFDVPDAKSRSTLCEDLIQARLTDPTTLQPAVPPSTAANICEMLAGKRAVTMPYGEHAVMAIAQRKDTGSNLKDFMIGCVIMTLGNGDAPLPIPVRLVSVNEPVPATTCGSVGEYCSSKCN